MSSESPSVIVYGSNGVEATVQSGSATPTNTPAIISAGSDGTNSRFITVDTSGRQVIVGPGTAGTPIGGVITIQGITSGIAINVSQATTANLLASVGGLGAAGSAAIGNPVYIGGSVTTSAPTYTTATINALSLTTSGLLRVDGTGGTFPVSGTIAVTQSTSPWVSNITQFGSVNISTGTGTSGTGIPRVTVSNDSNILTTQSGTWTVQPGNTANTTPWLTTINQGGNSAVVKAASTAAVATDQALVVAISPNNPISVGGVADTTASGALGALNAAVQVSLAGQHSVGIQLAAGTLIGTIVPEVSFDAGTTWVSTLFDDPVTSNKVSSIVFGSSNTATSRTIVGVGGTGLARVRVSAYTSGTANITLRAGQIHDPSLLFTGSAGGSLPGDIAQMGASVTTSAPSYSNATLNALSINTTGDLRTITKVTDGTNTAAVKAASTAAVATDPALVVAISPNNSLTVSAAATYGTNNQTITITLASLASTACRASTAIDNTTNKFRDALVQVTLKTNSAGVTNSGYVNVYAYGTVDGGTTYGEGATGTDAGITLTVSPNLKLIGSINAVAISTTYKSNPMSVAAAFNGRLPDHWGIVVENKTNAAFDATAGNFKVAYQGIS